MVCEVCVRCVWCVVCGVWCVRGVGVVLQPVAIDQDSGSNALIRYSLQVRLRGCMCGVWYV